MLKNFLLIVSICTIVSRLIFSGNVVLLPYNQDVEDEFNNSLTLNLFNSTTEHEHLYI